MNSKYYYFIFNTVHAFCVLIISYYFNFLAFIFKNKVTGKCLDGGFNGEVTIGRCNKGLSQSWKVFNGNRLMNVASGQCLEVAKLGNVVTNPCDLNQVNQVLKWPNKQQQMGPIQNPTLRVCIDHNAKAVYCYFGLNLIWESL